MERPLLRIPIILFIGLAILAACGKASGDNRIPADSLANSTSGGTFAYSFLPGTFELSKGGSPILTRMDAMIGIPDAHEPRPVVYLVHGDYPICTNASTAAGLTDSAVTINWPEVCGVLTAPGLEPAPGEAFPKGDDWISSEAGLSYLANAIREAGFVTVSIDLGGAGANITAEAGSSTEQAEAIIKAHQQVLADFANGESHGIAMPANTREVLGSPEYAVVGHSVGGGYAVDKALANTDPNMFATVGLQPALGDLKGTDDAEPTPTLLFWGTCDEDVPYDLVPKSLRDLKKADPDLVLSALKVDGATHFGANANLNQKVVLQVAHSKPGCKEPDAVMTPEVMQRGFSAEIAAFLKQAADGATEFTLPADAEFTPSVIEENGMSVTFEQTTLPAANVGSPALQLVDEQLLDHWNPKKNPPISAEAS